MRPCLENTDAIYSLSLFLFATFSKFSYFVRLSFSLSLSLSLYFLLASLFSLCILKCQHNLLKINEYWRQSCETALKFRCWLKRFHFVRFSVYSTLYTGNNILYRAYSWARMCTCINILYGVSVYVCVCMFFSRYVSPARTNYFTKYLLYHRVGNIKPVWYNRKLYTPIRF